MDTYNKMDYSKRERERERERERDKKANKIQRTKAIVDFSISILICTLRGQSASRKYVSNSDRSINAGVGGMSENNNINECYITKQMKKLNCGKSWCVTV
jgi:hypothetical protein